MSEELVTAVMVTGKHVERAPLAKESIQSFLQQTYPSKHLLIVTDHDEVHDVLEGYISGLDMGADTSIEVKKTSKGTLGELRNKALSYVPGNWVIQWDDDDWSAPHRITYQMQSAAKDTAVALNWQVRYSFTNNCAYELQWFGMLPGIPGTALYHVGNRTLRYRLEGKHEDSHFLKDHFNGRTTVLHNMPEAEYGPETFVRLYHGRHNTWELKHVMREYSLEKDVWDLCSRSKAYLKSVLDSHYKDTYATRLQNT